MAKVLLVLKVFLLVLTSEVLSVSVAETLFIALSEKLDSSLLKINERLDRLEHLVEIKDYSEDTGDDVKDNMEKGKDIYSEIMKANKRFKNAMSHEKQHVRLMLEEYGNEFREVRINVNHVLSEFNISMQATKDNMVQKIENNQDQLQSNISSLGNRVTTLNDVQKNTIKKLEDRMASSSNQLRSDISSLDSRVTTIHNKRAAFHVRLSTKTKYSSRSTILFDDVAYYTDSVYSSTTGRFTAPYTGIYLFSMSVHASGNRHADALLMVHGDAIMWAHSAKGSDVTSSNTCVTYMAKGEEAWIEAWNDGEFWGVRTQFTGVFLQEW